jgi:hypothetical protein
MKKVYEKPTIEIEAFEVEDIALTSGGLNGLPDLLSWDEIK